jgi:hypothetical protein
VPNSAPAARMQLKALAWHDDDAPADAAGGRDAGATAG